MSTWCISSANKKQQLFLLAIYVQANPYVPQISQICLICKMIQVQMWGYFNICSVTSMIASVFFIKQIYLIFLFMQITFKILHTHVSIHNSHTYKVYVTITYILHCTTIFVLLHTYKHKFQHFVFSEGQTTNYLWPY